LIWLRLFFSSPLHHRQLDEANAFHCC
jgi:hypothetical protein